MDEPTRRASRRSCNWKCKFTNDTIRGRLGSLSYDGWDLCRFSKRGRDILDLVLVPPLLLAILTSFSNFENRLRRIRDPCAATDCKRIKGNGKSVNEVVSAFGKKRSPCKGVDHGNYDRQNEEHRSHKVRYDCQSTQRTQWNHKIGDGQEIVKDKP